MLRLLTILLIICVRATVAVGQQAYQNKFYFSGSVGFGQNLSNSEGSVNGYDLRYSSSITNKGTAFVLLKNNIGLHLGFTYLKYHYEILKESILSLNQGYYSWNDYGYCDNLKYTFFAGIGYKWQHRRLVVIPFADLGIIPIQKAGIGTLELKEIDSNNQRKVHTTAKITSGRFDYTFGTDVYCYMWKHWGLAANARYDRYNPTVAYRTSISDLYGTQPEQFDQQTFRHSNIIFSFGLFMALFKQNTSSPE